MKILVFEYICGGGLAGQTLPESLAAEGRMMLQALLDDLKSVPGLELILPLDKRCMDLALPSQARVVSLDAGDDFQVLLSILIEQVDAVWPIAPETGGILADIAKQVQFAGKVLLLSDAETVSVCGNKLATHHCLRASGLPVVETLPLSDLRNSPFAISVIKPVDGVGCEGSRIIDDPVELHIPVNERVAYILQPWLAGQAISLSCIFKQGKGWLLCCNQQDVVIEDQKFCLRACMVNTVNEQHELYQALVDKVAQAMPGLWGYVGIDLIESTEYGPMILEINPRLTTSYVGILQASGINVVQQTLRLLEGEPDLTFTNQQTVKVVIH